MRRLEFGGIMKVVIDVEGDGFLYNQVRNMVALVGRPWALAGRADG
jgi:tRNA U38,U39,U40 pseudouridine synthase TruA